MDIKILQKNISEGFHKNIFLKEKRPNLYQVFLPFYYPDGDMIEIFLEVSANNNIIIIQDMGMTLMRLSYNFDLNSKNKKKVFNEILNNYQMEESEGSLKIIAPCDEIFSYLMQFIQVIIKISDLEFLKRETVKNLFYEYFEKFITVDLEKFNPIKEFYPAFDTKKQYPTPYAIPIKNKEHFCIYPIASDDKCNESIITIQHYELHNFRPETLAVFENQESIGRKPLAKLSNVVGKQFSALQGNERRIEEYFEKNCLV